MVPEIQGMTEFFCHSGPLFLPFDPPNNPKNQNFKIMKKKKKRKMPEDMILLHLRTRNEYHMISGA